MSRFDRVSLIEFCDNNGVVLDVIPDICNRDTRVSGQCLTENCDGRFEKSIRKLLDEGGGPHCKNCAMKNGHLKRILTMDYRFNKNNITKFCEKNGVVLDIIPNICNRNTHVSGQCITENCDGRFEKSIVGLLDISGPYCKICTTENTNRKKEETSMKNWSVSNPSQSEEVKQKKEETSMKNWSMSNPSQSEEVKQKVKETNMKNWGVPYTMQSEEVKQKAQETSIKNWGVSHPLKSKELRAAAIETNMLKYNTPYPTQNQDIKQKTRETNIRNLGVSYPMQSEHVRKKSQQVCIEKYGKPFPLQNAEILERALKSGYKRKLFLTPSGEEWSLQGYEPLVAPRLIEQYQEENITSDIKIVPAVPWTDSIGKTHVYRCDFYVESLKLIIEVKSTWTAQKDEEKIKKCMDYWSNQGNTYRLIISDNKGNYLYDRTNHDILSIPFDWHKSP